MSCLSDENLAAFIAGKGSSHELTTWTDHLTACDDCTLRLGRLQAGLRRNVGTSTVESTDPDATITVGP